MKITGTRNELENFMNRVYSRTAVRQLHVGQNQSGTSSSHRRQRLRMRARHFGDAMAQGLDKRLDIHRDYRFVLDDEDVGSDLVRNLDGGLVEQILRFFGFCSLAPGRSARC